MYSTKWLSTLALILLLSGCKVALYSGLSESEANQMLALLMASRIDAAKQINKDNTLTLAIDKSRFIEAVEILRQNGYPHPKYTSVMEVFPSNQLISSPEQERTKINYLKEQQIEAMLMNIDGVIVARASIGNALPDSLRTEAIKPTAAVFIKYSPKINFMNYEPQIRDLVRQSVPGIEEDKISVVLVPATYRLPASAPQQGWKQLMQNSLWLGSFIVMLCALLGASIIFWRWYRRRAQ